MNIVLNGEAVDTAADTLAALLVEIELEDAVVATALNGDLVPCDQRAKTILKDGDRVEVLAPMQGG